MENKTIDLSTLKGKAPGSSVGRAPDPRNRGQGVETSAGHLVVGSDST